MQEDFRGISHLCFLEINGLLRIYYLELLSKTWALKSDTFGFES